MDRASFLRVTIYDLILIFLIARREIRMIEIGFLPRVSNEVTPSVTRAGIASGFIQKAIQDMTTMRAEGM